MAGNRIPYLGVNIYIGIWFLQTLMCPILNSKDKKIVSIEEGPLLQGGGHKSCGKKMLLLGKLPIHAKCNCNIFRKYNIQSLLEQYNSELTKSEELIDHRTDRLILVSRF